MIHRGSLNDLCGDQKDFLSNFIGTEGIPIYVKLKNGDLGWVEGVACPMNRRGEFKGAPDGVFLGGAAVFILVKEGFCVVPDDRGGGRFKAAAQGWSLYDEGANPGLAALRELREEIVAFTLNGRIELVPPDVEPHCEVKCLKFELKGHEQRGEISFLRLNENLPERVIEFVFVWDLQSVVTEAISFGYDDEFFKGGFMGVNVHVLDADGGLIGQFSGQQGFLRTPKLALHPVVAQSLTALAEHSMAAT